MTQDNRAAQQGSRLGDGSAGAQTPKPKGEDQARTGGRGFLLITGAKVWFMIMGALVTLGLPAVLEVRDFGVYNIVINAVSLLNMVVITGTLQAVSKLVSERPSQGMRVLRRALLIQCFIGLPLGVSYMVGAEFIASLFYDPSLTPLIRVSGGVALAYSFYSILVGYLNGRKAFGRQAALDITFSTLKTGGIFSLVLLGFGVVGAIWGFVLAAVGVLLVAMGVVWQYQRSSAHTVPEEALDGDTSTDRRLIGYILLVMVYTFCIFGVLRADLFLLKSMIGAWSGLHETTLVADRVAGVYGAMQYVSRLPFQAVIAVTFVIFPMISKATFEQDTEATRVYIRGAMRYSLLMLGLLSALLAGNAQELIGVLFGKDYANGALALKILSVATVGYALFYIATTMITGAGRPLASALIALVTLVLTSVLNAGFVWGSLEANRGEESLFLAGSCATAAAMTLGFLVGLAYLHRSFGAGISLKTVGRVLVACGALLGVTWIAAVPEDWGKLMLLAAIIVKGLLGTGVFMVVLAGLGEFGPEDKQRLRHVLGRA